MNRPDSVGDHRAWVESLRGKKNPIRNVHECDFLVEAETVDRHGQAVSALTLFLVGAECPLRCTMCDLWKNTLDQATPAAAIPQQIHFALERTRSQAPSWVKLYNASNFFEPKAVPPKDLPHIAESLHQFERVVVENHPRFKSHRCVEFAESLTGQLEVAIGLESADDSILRFLAKSITLQGIETYIAWLKSYEIDMRCFVMLQPPPLGPDQSLGKCVASIRWSAQRGVRHCSIIPSRAGNGAMEQLMQEGTFRPPTLGQLELSLEHALECVEDCKSEMVVTVDLWDAEKLDGACRACRSQRIARLSEMNARQCWRPFPHLTCGCVK